MVLSAIEEIEKKGILIYAMNENYRSWDVTIFGRYTTEAFFAAMIKNKQLTQVKGDTE